MTVNEIKNMSREIEFGVLLHTRHLIRDDGLAPSFKTIWEEAALAEKLGMDHVWIGDSVTVLDRARGDCLTLMASLAMKTTRVKIGTVPLLPAMRSPGIASSHSRDARRDLTGSCSNWRQCRAVPTLHTASVRSMRRSVFRKGRST